MEIITNISHAHSTPTLNNVLTQAIQDTLRRTPLPWLHSNIPQNWTYVFKISAEMLYHFIIIYLTNLLFGGI